MKKIRDIVEIECKELRKIARALSNAGVPYEVVFGDKANEEHYYMLCVPNVDDWNNHIETHGRVGCRIVADAGNVCFKVQYSDEAAVRVFPVEDYYDITLKVRNAWYRPQIDSTIADLTGKEEGSEDWCRSEIERLRQRVEVLEKEAEIRRGIVVPEPNFCPVRCRNFEEKCWHFRG